MSKRRWKMPSLGQTKPDDGRAAVAGLIRELSRRLSDLRQGNVLESQIFCRQVSLRLRVVLADIAELATGKLVFSSTETWRTVYQEVLESADVKRYLSVALIRSDDYWRDAPGESSLNFNYDLVSHGYHIHRLFIIDEFFWPRGSRAPGKQLLHWIMEQYHRGIDVSLVRLTDLDDEPSLVCDIGIYGQHAVGQQETDFEGRTTRFELSFSPDAVQQAEQRWQQLMVYAHPLQDIMDTN